MVWSAGQHHCLFLVITRVFERVFTRFLDVILDALVFRSRHLDSIFELQPAHACAPEHLVKLPHEVLVVVIRQERMRERHAVLLEYIVHVSGNHFRICRNDRAVVMVRRRLILHSLVVDARIEDPLRTVLHEPLDVPVHHLCRIACRIRRDSLHTSLVHLLAGRR